jgi:hypothetical protein
VLGGYPGADAVGGGGQVVQGGQHRLVIGSGPGEDLGVRGGQAGLGGLQVTEQTGQRTLFRTAQIAHTPNITGYWLFVQVAECLLCAPARLGEPA